MSKRVIVSVTNDICTDQRVHKTCLFLTKKGFEVTVVGRKLNSSLSLDDRPYKNHRFNLLFNKGFLFYAEFNLRLFLYLLFRKPLFLLSNDLDTLLPNYLVSKLKGIGLVYDSHEYFTEVPEIVNRKLVKAVWTRLEEFIFPKLKYVYTVNISIANLFKDKYYKDVKVVRNIPLRKTIEFTKTRKELGLPEDKKIIIIQGAGINVDRGSEEAVEAMQYIKNAILLIVGSGDVVDFLKDYVKKNNLEQKVFFKGRVPYCELMEYTNLADLGLTLDKDTNINYKYSLPNKLFDYIQAEVPVISTKLVEISRVIKQYEIGDFIDNHNSKHIAEKINEILSDENKLKSWKTNLKKASEELVWENEEKNLEQIYSDFINA